MRIQRQAAVALTLLGLFAPACDDDEEFDQTLLVVQASREQPTRDDLGVIVEIQAWRGTWLELEVSGGKLVGGGTETCMPAPTAALLRDSRTEVLVFPDRVEAVLTVRLFSDVPRLPEGEGGSDESRASSAEHETGACRIDARPLREEIEPVRRVTALTPASGGTAGAATGGSAGSGGAAGSGSGAGGSEGGSAGDQDGGAGSDQGGAAGEGVGGAGGNAQGGSAGASAGAPGSAGESSASAGAGGASDASGGSS